MARDLLALLALLPKDLQSFLSRQQKKIRILKIFKATKMHANNIKGRKLKFKFKKNKMRKNKLSEIQILKLLTVQVKALNLEQYNKILLLEQSILIIMYLKIL